MKFVTIFKLKPDNIEKILQRMENIEMPKGIRILGEWLGSNRDVLVYEAETNEAVNRLEFLWMDVMDYETFPVIETRQLWQRDDVRKKAHETLHEFQSIGIRKKFC